MARAATKRGKRPQPNARQQQQPRKRSGRRQLSSTEETLFFTRIRAHAKWAFVLLAFIFALGFVGLGVGSGSGVDFSSLWHWGGGGGGPSVSKALKATQENPSDAKAWRDLSTAYTDKGQTDDAISALTTYTALRPKDKTALADLVSLQVTNAQGLQQNQAILQYKGQAAYLSGPIVASTTPLGKALGTDPVQQAAQTAAQTAADDASVATQTAWTQAIGTAKKLAAAAPKDVGAQSTLLNTAQLAAAVIPSLGTPAEILAYKNLAKLQPDQAAEIKKKIKQLQSGSAG
jgi:tetratricopeptide (TPR) repeat protein